MTGAGTMDPCRNRPDAAFWALERFGSRTALHDGDQAIDYLTLARLADAQTAALQPRQVLALECTNSLATVATYLGALRRGAVPLMVDASLPETARAALYWHYRIGRAFDGGSGRWRDTGVAPADAVQGHPALGLLLSTSGSTASPKLVRLTRDNLAANAASIVDYLGLDRGEVAITTLPLHYSYGLSVLNSHLACGARLVLTDQPVTAAPFWQQVAARGVTSLSGVPTLWRLLCRMRFERMSLPSVRSFTQAGGRLEPDEVRKLHAIAVAGGRSLFIMYGQTEASARIAYLPPALLPAKAGSIGIAIPGGQLHLVDAQGATLETPGVAGELVYRGPNVMLGYAEQADDLALGRSIDELHTGDLGQIDADGCCWITGRLKRFIKLFGHRVSLDEVEQGLRQQGLDAGVTGRDDRLMVGLAGADAAQAVALRGQLAAQLRVHASALQVTPLPALPLASNGKLQYGQLQQLLDAAAPPTPAPTFTAGAAHAR